MSTSPAQISDAVLWRIDGGVRKARRARWRIFAGLAVTALAVAGCSSSSGDSGSGPADTSSAATSAAPTGPVLKGSIVVFAAASLTGTFTELGKQFEAAHPGVTVTFSYGGSSDLATSINGGAPGDVFASASANTMNTVVQAGNATGPQNFARNVMEIATVPGNPKGIKSLADLTSSSLKVAICQARVPCGDAATALFAKAGLTITPVTLEKDVKSTLAKVTSKEVDAGIVYVTDVKAAGSSVTGVQIPDAQNYVTTYPIATLKETKNAETAQAFVDFVLGEDGQLVMKKAGFLSA